MSKMPKLGIGKMFANIKENLANQGVEHPATLADSIGKKKFGDKKMERIATAARKTKIKK